MFKLVSAVLGASLAMATTSVVQRIPVDGKTKTVAEVRSYREKSQWSDWQTRLITDGDGLYPYCVLIAEDGTHLRVNCEPAVEKGDVYTSAAWSDISAPRP